MKNYYVGINGTNVICNGEYFDGYITAYPMGEEGNISYLKDAKKTENFSELEFKKWAQSKILEILKSDSDARFTFFNKKMASVCAVLDQKNIQGHNDWELLNFLNNKFKIRNYLSSKVKLLDYLYLFGDKIDYNTIKDYFVADKFVLQSSNGSGGLTTHSINCAEDILKLKLSKDVEYCISQYEKNLPINSTLMIASKNIAQMQISAQLIKNNGNFIYSGGDFVMPKLLKPKISEQIVTYNNIIGEELQKLGYRGICGVDYIVCEDGAVKFMEINPRYQGSSFILSMAMKKIRTSIARLNAECFENSNIFVPSIDVDKSFVNCQSMHDYIALGKPDEIIKKVDGATFRKIFNRSIIIEDEFEKPEDLSAICDM